MAPARATLAAWSLSWWRGAIGFQVFWGSFKAQQEACRQKITLSSTNSASPDTSPRNLARAGGTGATAPVQVVPCFTTLTQPPGVLCNLDQNHPGQEQICLRGSG